MSNPFTAWVMSKRQRGKFDEYRNTLRPYLDPTDFKMAWAIPWSYTAGIYYDEFKRRAKAAYAPVALANTAYNVASAAKKKVSNWFAPRKNPYLPVFQPRMNNRSYVPYGNYIKNSYSRNYYGISKRRNAKAKTYQKKTRKAYYRKKY